MENSRLRRWSDARWESKFPLLRKYLPLVHEDLGHIYSRGLFKWLVIAPIIGVVTGLAITAVAVVILRVVWPPVLAFYLQHHWAIIPGIAFGFLVTGLIMQFLTPDPNEHSTEEVIRSYHEHGGVIDMRPFFSKLLAAVTTVGSGGSAALEGPSIYGGAAIGSWIWARARRFKLNPRDRRVMLISGAAAGMAAVFRAPLTGMVFALEMPYRDDLAHEALLPSLIASVVSYITLAAFLGAAPLFNFASSESFTGRDLVWCALLGLVIGLAAMVFDTTFRRARQFVVAWSIPHWLKLTLGGALTGVCGLIFLMIYPGQLVPIGPNYEAVGMILDTRHSAPELISFGVLKLLATIFSLGSGGVSAMFVPLFLTGGSFGTAFADLAAHSTNLELYAAVGMASFIAAGYKTPLAAVVFVAEATGGHAFIIPALIGSAVAYGVSGDASVSGDQQLHEGTRIAELQNQKVGEIMERRIVCVSPNLNLGEFAALAAPEHGQDCFPVVENHRALGVAHVKSLMQVTTEKWTQTQVADIVDRKVKQVPPDCDAMEALRLLSADQTAQILLVTTENQSLQGIVTRTEILKALNGARDSA
jgi:chloride channel protein, CIC family